MFVSLTRRNGEVFLALFSLPRWGAKYILMLLDSLLLLAQVNLPLRWGIKPSKTPGCETSLSNICVERDEIHSGEKKRSGRCVSTSLTSLRTTTELYIHESAISGDRIGCPELDNQIAQVVLQCAKTR